MQNEKEKCSEWMQGVRSFLDYQGKEVNPNEQNGRCLFGLAVEHNGEGNNPMSIALYGSGADLKKMMLAAASQSEVLEEVFKQVGQIIALNEICEKLDKKE